MDLGFTSEITLRHVLNAENKLAYTQKSVRMKTMETTTAYSWVPVFERIATALLAFANKRQQLIQSVVKEFESQELKIPKWSNNGIPTDIDPFTLLGCINRNKMTVPNRAAYAHALAHALGINADGLKDFVGIPVLDPRKAAFYEWEALEAPEAQEINNLWKLFQSAIELADTPTLANERTFAEWFDKVEQQPQVRWNLTMGLYWIRPNYFVNLDSLNRTYLSNFEDFKNLVSTSDAVPDGFTYLNLCKTCQKWVQDSASPCHNIPEISRMAYLNWQKSQPETSKQPQTKQRCWVMACKDADGEYWDICFEKHKMILGYGLVGNLLDFSDKNAVCEALNRTYETSFSSSSHWPNWLWKFAHEVKPGDIVYAKSGTHCIRGRGIVTEGYSYSKNPEVAHFNHELSVDWQTTESIICEEEIFARMQTIQEVNVEKKRILESVYPEKGTIQPILPIEEQSHTLIPKQTPYSKETFLSEVFVSESLYEKMVAALRYKGNIILQGAPGVGKSFSARRLAYAFMGEKDDARISMVQFHHSYSYEEFVEGYRPEEDGQFKLKHGSFYDFCKRAAKDNERPYFYIVDEINRGNLNKIFGETFLLLEKDKRGTGVQLLYSKETFTIPSNIYIIGMMNTADRSIALMDHALRRRFAFIDIPPAFGQPSFEELITSAPAVRLHPLIQELNKLNTVIAEDPGLGKGYRIGHSYFCPENMEELTDKQLELVVEFELIPLLEEYWCEEAGKVEEWSARLRDAVQIP